MIALITVLEQKGIILTRQEIIEVIKMLKRTTFQGPSYPT